MEIPRFSAWWVHPNTALHLEATCVLTTRDVDLSLLPHPILTMATVLIADMIPQTAIDLNNTELIVKIQSSWAQFQLSFGTVPWIAQAT
jgi:hypothetical protein